MLNYDPHEDVWYADAPNPTLAEDIYDELGVKFAFYDYLREQSAGEMTPRLERLDAYITGLEKLLIWE